MPNTKSQISVIVPMYNEVENTEPLLTEIATAMQNWAEFEIIAVDDCSTDGTTEKLQTLKSQITNLRVIHHQRNLGQSNAVVSGIYAAHYDCIATLDGDGQNNPADIIHLFEAAQSAQLPLNKILVAGNRQKRNDSFVRLLSSRLANWVRS
ncbi:MAG TPA: glycosyltransferase family 2 protein, partial [Coxiellaceae bacterium]|nr:glycosyltransferase family 2 protein [Coxiellaceae bacterium]